MIILFDTNFTNIAMIASSRFSSGTFETNFFGLFDIHLDVFRLLFLRWKQQWKIKQKHHTHKNCFKDIEEKEVILKNKQSMKNSQSHQSGHNESDGYC